MYIDIRHWELWKKWSGERCATTDSFFTQHPNELLKTDREEIRTFLKILTQPFILTSEMAVLGPVCAAVDVPDSLTTIHRLLSYHQNLNGEKLQPLILEQIEFNRRQAREANMKMAEYTNEKIEKLQQRVGYLEDFIKEIQKVTMGTRRYWLVVPENPSETVQEIVARCSNPSCLSWIRNVEDIQRLPLGLDHNIVAHTFIGDKHLAAEFYVKWTTSEHRASLEKAWTTGQKNPFLFSYLSYNQTFDMNLEQRVADFQERYLGSALDMTATYKALEKQLDLSPLLVVDWSAEGSQQYFVDHTDEYSTGNIRFFLRKPSPKLDE